jgi:hypothetical protein
MLEVTLNIYSGRPNPQWALTDAQESSFLSQLDQIRKTTLTKPSGVLPRLGYRGFHVRRSTQAPQGPLSVLVHDQIVDLGQTEPSKIADNRDLEQWLLETATVEIPPQVRSAVTDDLNRSHLDAGGHLGAAATDVDCPPCLAKDAPAYNPALWDAEAVRQNNNCYNYANDQVTNTYAQPGSAHGFACDPNVRCDDYQNAAAADLLVRSHTFTNPLAAGRGWYVALTIWPGVDFHWYRQDANGCWSHKPGQTPATNLDNDGKPIWDPAMCRLGPYDFCSYMTTNRKVVIK